jgi:aryl-alcohol dehydrogenase-like predicted oxidoreductase
MNRRAFIKNVGAAIVGGAAGLSLANTSRGADHASAAGERSASPMRTRRLGRTGHRSSLITFGGIAAAGLSDREATDLVAYALDAGVNALDVAPTYGDAELKLGVALAGKRDGIFLQCKTLERSKEGAAKELRESLRRLRTDHVDLYQLHGLNKPEELDQALGPGGAMEAFLEARQAGLTRFIGISGHRPATLIDALKRFPFDTMMLPVNFVLEQHQFAQGVLAEAGRRGVGVMAIKALAARPRREGEAGRYPKCWYWPLEDEREIALALAFSLSQAIATAIPPGEAPLLRKAIAAAQRYRRLSASDAEELAALAKPLKPIFPVD